MVHWFHDFGASWRPRAACRGVDVHVFMSTGRQTQAQALSICGQCPVIWNCLQYAIKFSEKQLVGVWGGTTTNDRRRIRRHLGLDQQRTHRGT